MKKLVAEQHETYVNNESESSKPSDLDALVQRFDQKFELVQTAVDRLTASHEASIRKVDLLQAAVEKLLRMKPLEEEIAESTGPVLE